MNSLSLKNSAAIAAVLSGFIGSPAAQAAFINGSLGTNLASADIYRVTCPFNAVRLTANITDTLLPFVPSTSVRLSLVNVNPSPPTDPISATVTDNENPGFFQLPSSTISLPKGAGFNSQFYLYASKVGPLFPVSESYRISYFCRNFFNVIVPAVSEQQIQNQ